MKKAFIIILMLVAVSLNGINWIDFFEGNVLEKLDNSYGYTVYASKGIQFWDYQYFEITVIDLHPDIKGQEVILKFMYFHKKSRLRIWVPVLNAWKKFTRRKLFLALSGG